MRVLKEYFLQPRVDVAALVPPLAHRVLDLGCGFGALGKLLVATQGCDVHGVERNTEAEQYLKGIYTRYVIGDVETAVHECAAWHYHYDCIIFADLLEHLVDPWTALKVYSGLLAPTGVIVASIPNVRNLTVLFNLAVRGRWKYATSGLLDRTHLRFFTRAEIHHLFQEAGLAIDRIEVNRDRFPFPRSIATAIPGLFIPDLAVCQFLVVARPR